LIVCQVTDLVYYKLIFCIYVTFFRAQPMTIGLLPHGQQALCVRYYRSNHECRVGYSTKVGVFRQTLFQNLWKE